MDERIIFDGILLINEKILETDALLDDVCRGMKIKIAVMKENGSQSHNSESEKFLQLELQKLEVIREELFDKGASMVSRAFELLQEIVLEKALVAALRE